MTQLQKEFKGMDPLIGAAAGLVGKLIGEIISSASEPISKQIEEWRTTARIKALGKKLAHFELVKTLSNPEKAQKIKDFYLPPKFAYGNGKQFSVSRLENFGIEEHPLIEGIAGQGKSIFMRQLFIEEIKTGERLPVLIELRRITQQVNLIDLIHSQLTALGFPQPAHIWTSLAGTGKAVLLLDGFDELREELRSSLLSEVETIVITYTDLRLVITTRPEAAIRGAAYLRSVKLQPLDTADRNKIITKICDDQTAKGLIAGLKKNQTLSQMVDTPLFATLLCVAYRAEQHIPETTHEFYDLVFNTLLYRHDALKLGFERPRKSELGNHIFCKTFECFCFLTARAQMVRMTESKANEFIAEALNNENQSESISDKYFDDLVKITCLLVKDGTDFQFLHKSIQDYFCAKYIARMPDDAAKKIYSKLLTQPRRIRQLNQTLNFLSEIDTIRFVENFELPGLSLIMTGSAENVDNLHKFECKENEICNFMGYLGGILFEENYVFSGTMVRGEISNISTESAIAAAINDFFDAQRNISNITFLASQKALESGDYREIIKKYLSDKRNTKEESELFGKDENVIFIIKLIKLLGVEAKKEFIHEGNNNPIMKSLKTHIKDRLDQLKRSKQLASELAL